MTDTLQVWLQVVSPVKLQSISCIYIVQSNGPITGINLMLCAKKKDPNMVIKGDYKAIHNNLDTTLPLGSTPWHSVISEGALYSP